MLRYRPHWCEGCGTCTDWLVREERQIRCMRCKQPPTSEDKPDYPEQYREQLISHYYRGDA